MATKVSNFRIKGHYKIQKGRFVFPFEKEIRAVSAENAVEKVKQFIACRNVNINRIKIEKIFRIDASNINNRVVKAFAEENIKI
ncbi:MAG: hypothetical protein ACTSUE_11965 [Promethearchaeota archaeon]